MKEDIRFEMLDMNTTETKRYGRAKLDSILAPDESARGDRHADSGLPCLVASSTRKVLYDFGPEMV